MNPYKQAAYTLGVAIFTLIVYKLCNVELNVATVSIAFTLAILMQAYSTDQEMKKNASKTN